MEKRSKVSTIVGLILLAAFVIYYISMTVIDLVSLGNAVEINTETFENVSDGKSIYGDFFYMDCAPDNEPLFTMKHSINGIIPTGNEYYFLLYNDVEDKALYVRADKNFAKDFDADFAENEKLYEEGSISRMKGVTVKGRIREMPSSIRVEIGSLNSQLDSWGIEVLREDGQILYLDVTTKFQCILRIITVVLASISAFIIVIFARRKSYPNKEIADKILGIIAVIFVIAAVCTMIYTMTFMM